MEETLICLNIGAKLLAKQSVMWKILLDDIPNTLVLLFKNERGEKEYTKKRKKSVQSKPWNKVSMHPCFTSQKERR